MRREKAFAIKQLNETPDLEAEDTRLKGLDGFWMSDGKKVCNHENLEVEA
jgi:hypothetical protein